MKTRMAALAALALACSASAQAQPYDDRRGGWDGGRGGDITLYPSPDFRGPGFTASREFSNLPRQFNDGAMSLRVGRGAWEVCSDADFGGRCQVVTRDVRDLRQLGLAGVISSVRPARGGGDWGGGWGGGGGGWGGGSHPGGGGYGGVATLFTGPEYSGAGFSTTREYSNLPRQNNDKALSLRIERGTWEVCSDANFRGNCQVFRRSVPDLRAFGLGEAVSSLRPVR